MWPVVWVWWAAVAFRWECACHSKLSSGTTHSVWSADPCFTCEINTLPFKARSASYSTRSLLIYRNFLKLSLKGSWKNTERKRKRERRKKKPARRGWLTQRCIWRTARSHDQPLLQPLMRMRGYLNEQVCKWEDVRLNRICAGTEVDILDQKKPVSEINWIIFVILGQQLPLSLIFLGSKKWFLMKSLKKIHTKKQPV